MSNMNKNFQQDTSNLTLLGQSGVGAQDNLECFPTPRTQSGTSTGEMVITFSTDEFTSHCPVTNQPDFGSIIIKYSPKNLCLESKSLKLYLATFRDQAHFWEKLALIIAERISQAVEPNWVEVTTLQRPRGGISLETTVILGEV